MPKCSRCDSEAIVRIMTYGKHGREREIVFACAECSEKIAGENWDWSHEYNVCCPGCYLEFRV